MSDTRLMRRPFSWSSIAAIVVEAAAACCFVVAVYELVVAGGIAALGGGWKPVLWVAAAVLSGSGMTVVRSAARNLGRRLFPAPDPYAALKSSVSGAVAAGPVEDVMSRLAQLLADGTAARSAAVWLHGPSGRLRRAASWPAEDGPDEPATVPDEAALQALASVDYLAPVRDHGEVVGWLTLRARAGRFLALPDVRLATDLANSAGLLLRNADLADDLREQVRVEKVQAADLIASARRLLVARDAAREQLSAEIRSRVCAPLERCGQRVDAVLGTTEAGDIPAAGLAEMAGDIDAAIADFRRIVHSVYPPVLTDHGLRAALESLLTDVDPRASLVSHRIPRLAARVEAGTYFCAAALLRDWDTTGAQRPMRVLVGATSTRIQLTFVDGVPAAGEGAAGERPAVPVSQLVFEAVQDRVAALEGRMQVDGDQSGRWLVIEMPLTTADLVAQVSKAAR